MAKAQANKSVYNRMRAKLSPTDNGTGGMDAQKFVPGGTYSRQSAGSADNGKAKYTRKSAK